MAGAGYKLFNTGDVLTAAQVNTYLQEQTVMVFANSTARTTALSGVLAEGMMSYLQDTNAVEVYNGSSWVNVGNSGDITGVTAGIGISGGGTSGDVTITNSMATAIDAKGDLIVGTGADTFSRLAVGGTNGHVLTVDSGESTGMKWAAVAAGGGAYTSLASGSLSGSSVSISSISGSYNDLYLVIRGSNLSQDASERIRPNGATTGYMTGGFSGSNNGFGGYQEENNGIYMNIPLLAANESGITTNSYVLWFYDYANTSTHKVIACYRTPYEANDAAAVAFSVTRYSSTSAISSIDITTDAGTFSGGTYVLYGVK